MSRNRFISAMLILFTASLAQAVGLRGAILIAADGTFLGTCDGKYSNTSIVNPYSPYGSPYTQSSIFNQYGPYGSKYTTNSAFNPYTLTAPYLLAADPSLLRSITSAGYRPTSGFLNALRTSGGSRVSANISIPNGIDPNVLRSRCESP